MEKNEQDLVIDEETGYYNRSVCRERIAASKMIQELYVGSESSVIVSSGMNGIYLILSTVLRLKTSTNPTSQKLTFLFSNELYTDSKNKVIRMLKSQYGSQINFVSFNYKKRNHFESLIKNYARSLVCIFFEAVSNPSSYLIDFEFLQKVRSECYVIVDNTWMTPLCFNPFRYRVDCVVDSCTKYLSGGKCIAGHLTFRREKNLVTKEIENLIRVMGIHVSPIHCKLIQEGIKSMKKNVEIMSKKTEEVVKMLDSQENVIQVLHPSLPSHVSHQLFKKFHISFDTMKGMPCVVWFHVKVGQDLLSDKKNWKFRLGEIVKKNGIRFATSFGKPYSLIDMWPKKDKKGLWLRLSVGYGTENNEDLLKCLKCMLRDLQ